MKFFLLDALLLSRRCLLPVVLALGLTGCGGSVLFSDLGEEEANSIIAVLDESGISAEKQRQDSTSLYRVLTENSKFVAATNVLEDHALPRKKYESLGDVFQEDGFATSSISQKARYVHALSQELSHTISLIDGVLIARVHLVIPEAEYFSDDTKESSASVFIKHRADVNLEEYTNQIKALIVDGLVALTYQNVTVVYVPAEVRRRNRSVQNETNESPGLLSGVSVERLVILGLLILIVFLLVVGRSRISRDATTIKMPTQET